jgi:PEGA domain
MLDRCSLPGRGRARSWHLLGLITIAWLPSGRPARADGVPAAETATQEDKAEAKAQAEAKVAAARDLYERGDFQAALVTLEEAYALYPSPKLFFNLGVVQRGMGRDVEALASFERFLAEGGAAAPAERREDAERHVAALRGRVAFLDVVSDVSEAEVFVDGRRYGKTPVLAPIVVAPGPHQVLVQKQGAPLAYTDRIEARAGALVRVQVRLSGVSQVIAAHPPPGVAPEPEVAIEPVPDSVVPTSWATPLGPKRSTVLRQASFALGFLGITGLATGGIFSLRVYTLKAQLREDAAKPEGQFPEDFATKREAGKRYARYQYPAYIAGGTLLAGGIACYVVAWLRDRKRNEDHALVVVPAIVDRHGALLIGARF